MAGHSLPSNGNPAYQGMTELQVLDTSIQVSWSILYHGSVYGLIPAARGYLYEAGNWNYEEVTVQGTKIKVELNGAVILDDVAELAKDPEVLKKHLA